MQVRAVEEHDVVETLDAVERLHAVRTDADARLFELAAHFADLHPAESLRPGESAGAALPGMERTVRLGGVGTPSVAEFAVAELGARMQMGTWSARRFVADAVDVRHRLPLIWARVQARQARIGNARMVAAKTRHLSVEAAASVDRAMVDFVDGSLPWGRFEARLDGRIVAADPDVAAAREQASVQLQFAKRTRSSENGTVGFYLRSTVGVVARIDATLSYVAEALKAFGDPDDVDRRRVKALVILANPARAVELLAAFAALRARSVDVPLPIEDVPPPTDDLPLSTHDTVAVQGPTGVREAELPDPLERMDAFARRVGFRPTRLPSWLVGAGSVEAGPPRPEFRFDWSRLLPPLTLHLHLSAEDLVRGEGGVVRWEGEGPVTHQFVHEHLNPMHAYRLQPVIDLAAMAPADAYEIPDRHRAAVRLRTPADCFPFASATCTAVDVDHTDAYRCAPGTETEAQRAEQSRLENYGPLSRFHHRIKTHGHWTLRQPFSGIYLWRDPHGQVYLVDHTGSHKVTPSGLTAGAAADVDPEIEVYPADNLVEVRFDRSG